MADSTMADSDPSPKDDGEASAGGAGPDDGALAEPANARAETPEPGEPGLGARGPLLIASAVAVLFFFVLPPLTKSGLWDPYELNVADLARRVALNLHGAASLALEGADNSLPHLNDLGRPQLPFTSIALGFKLFGLREWAGRAPLALWGVLGVLATYGFVARLVDRRAGLLSAIALTTMPLYFVQARTMLGDIVMMAGFAMAFGGLGVAVFGSRSEERRVGTPHGAGLVVALAGGLGGLGAVALAALGGTRDERVRSSWYALGFLGLAVGFFTRGALLGVAVPALAVGAAYLIAAASRQRFDALAHTAGIVACALGGAFAAVGLAAIFAEQADDRTVIWAGALLNAPAKHPTFDFMIGHIAEALVPWSAFAPFAFGRMFASPPGVRDEDFARESQARLLLLVGAAAAFVAHGAIAPRVDLIAFSAPAVIAAACGIALRDYERGAHPSVAVGVGTAVLVGLFHHELRKLPEKAFHAFAIASGVTFPESFKSTSTSLWTVVLFAFAAIAFLTWVEREPAREPFEPKGYLRVLLALRDVYDGMLALAYFAVVAGASLAGLGVWLGARYQAKWLPQLSGQMREIVLNAWWITAFVPLAAIFFVFFWCDVWVWAFDRAPRARAGLGNALTRGFEPFERLAARLREGRLLETVPKLIMGKLVVTKDDLEDGVGPTALFVLAPLLYLQIPAVAFLAFTSKLGVRPLAAAALSLPSGLALFVVLGAVGSLVRGSRTAFFVLFGAAVSAVLCTAYYPALANQLSPKEIFESYQRTRRGDEPLALFGVGGRTAAYYAGAQPTLLKGTEGALDWLMGAEPGTRRFVAASTSELARLNRGYRERAPERQNLPVIDGRSSQIVLLASSLEPGQKNENPLSRFILAEPPSPQRKIEAVFEDKLELLGYDVVDAAGKLVTRVAPGKTYRIRTYFKVLRPMSTEWEMFIHVDGFRRRHNGDHKLCDGRYPVSLWLEGDLIMDEYELKLAPNFSAGAYTVWLGLFVGDTRFKVASGPTDGDNRINGGTLRVQ